jgi:hypothetical protein
MKQSEEPADINVNRHAPRTAKSTTLKINLEASFTHVIQNDGVPTNDQQNVYARELASPVLHIAKNYDG